MSDPYVPPDDPEERGIEILLDPWIQYARWGLWFGGAWNLLMGLALGPLSSLSFWSDPDGQVFALVMTVVLTVVTLAIFGVFGAACVVAANGIGRGSRWAWYLGVGLGVLYLPGCWPLGGVVLFGLLKDKTRKLFGL